MKRNIINGIILLLAGYCVVLAASGPGQSPISSPTTVPSSNGNGLVKSSINYDGSEGNAIVAGNVGGGREFRGVVPYGSSYYTQSSTRTSVDNFLRRAGGNPITQDRNPGVYGQYYDSRRTVASVAGRDSRGALVAPQSYLQGGSSGSLSTTPVLPSLASVRAAQQRPLSMPASELESALKRQIEKTVADELLFQRVKDYVPDKKEVSDKKIGPSQSIFLLPEQRETTDVLRGQVEKEDRKKEIQPSRYEQLRVKMEEERNQEEQEALHQKELEESARENEFEGALDKIAGAKGRYKSFASLAEAKAAEYMTAARQFLMEGKYYKAADSFAMAAVWQPDNASTYIGQVCSLFAAGEYMSSAYYLSQTLILRPQLASAKIDLMALMPDRDIFENRLIEITECLQRNQSGELAFLKAYVLWQDGKNVKAREAITNAVELIPASPAIRALADVITAPETLKSNGPETTTKEPNQQ